MLECKDIRPLLPDYAAGNLTEETAAQVADHLLLCPICAAQLEQLRVTQYQVGKRQRTQGPNISAQQEQVPEQGACSKCGLRLRTKVLLILLALLLVAVGACLGFLHSREVFAICDWAKSADGRFVALVYEGTDTDQDGFRLKLWDKQEEEWIQQEVFSQENYCEMQWSPDSAFLALESREARGLCKVQLLPVRDEGQRKDLIQLYTLVSGQLKDPNGIFKQSMLTDVPSCHIMSWTDDSAALLMYAEQEITEDSDSGAAAFIRGCLMYDVNTYYLDVVRGFGLVTPEQQEYRNNQIQSRFMEYMTKPGEPLLGMDRETLFGEKALLKLSLAEADGVTLQLYFDYGNRFVNISTSVMDNVMRDLDDATGIMLILGRENFRQDPVRNAYLILPYPSAYK